MAGPEHSPISPLGGVRAFQCPNCGGQVELRAPGQTMRAICNHCSSVLDATDPTLRIIQLYNEKITAKPIIPLGARGKFEGEEWEVIGFMTRQAVGYDYHWEEYLLFNPYLGFRWLLDQYGHWSYTTPLVITPETRQNHRVAYHKGDAYNAFSKGKAEVTFVMGEFYWEVKAGETVKTWDLVRSGEMVSVEYDDKGKNWTHSQYIEPKAISEAFGQELAFRSKKGIAPHQVNPLQKLFKSILPVWLVALALLIVGHFVFQGSSSNELVATMEGISLKDAPEKVSDPFRIEGSTSNVEIEMVTSGLSNSWMEGAGYLRNRSTNQAYDFTLSAEYYSGYTDGESWSEGDQSPAQVLNLIPSGEYELVIQFYQMDPSVPYTIRVKRDVPIWTNLFIVLVIITLPVILIGGFATNFRKKQWADSDFYSQ